MKCSGSWVCDRLQFLPSQHIARAAGITGAEDDRADDQPEETKSSQTRADPWDPWAGIGDGCLFVRPIRSQAVADNKGLRKRGQCLGMQKPRGAVSHIMPLLAAPPGYDEMKNKRAVPEPMLPLATSQEDIESKQQKSFPGGIFAMTNIITTWHD